MSHTKSSRKILIVEDNPLNMKLFSDLLEAHGFKTVQVMTGHRVPELTRRHKPDLIILDIQLGEISGLDVARELKDDEDLCHIPIMAVTAFAMRGDEEKVIRAGCDAYMSKPISLAPFIDAVRRLLAIAGVTPHSLAS